MISSISYPSGQQIHIDPYNGKLFDFNSHQSRVYLGRSINQLLNVFGDNCIIDGLKVDRITLENRSDKIILSCFINPGKVIIDTTLIEFPTPINLEADVSTLDEKSGFFVISLAFNYLEDNFGNKAKFRLSFVDNSGHCPDFYTELDKIIFTKIIIDKTKLVANYTYSYYTNSETVTINETLYKIFPADSITKSVIKAIQEIFFI